MVFILKSTILLYFILILGVSEVSMLIRNAKSTDNVFKFEMFPVFMTILPD